MNPIDRDRLEDALRIVYDSSWIDYERLRAAIKAINILRAELASQSVKKIKE